jgi:hypothetical protein
MTRSLVIAVLLASTGSASLERNEITLVKKIA